MPRSACTPLRRRLRERRYLFGNLCEILDTSACVINAPSDIEGSCFELLSGTRLELERGKLIDRNNLNPVPRFILSGAPDISNG